MGISSWGGIKEEGGGEKLQLEERKVFEAQKNNSDSSVFALPLKFMRTPPPKDIKEGFDRGTLQVTTNLPPKTTLIRKRTY